MIVKEGVILKTYDFLLYIIPQLGKLLSSLPRSGVVMQRKTLPRLINDAREPYLFRCFGKGAIFSADFPKRLNTRNVSGNPLRSASFHSRNNKLKKVEAYFPGDDLFAPLRRKGLPIGNLTSQFFANIYLNKLDHFLKDELGCKYYVRYVDDFVVLSNNKPELHDIKQKISEFLENYRLKLHPNKCHIFPVDVGITFLGHRVFPYFKLLKKENVIRFKRRIKTLQRDYARGRIDFERLNQSIQSWIGHAAFSNTYRLRSKIFSEHPFIRVRYKG
jgi:hypothetical protein